MQIFCQNKEQWSPNFLSLTIFSPCFCKREMLNTRTPKQVRVIAVRQHKRPTLAVVWGPQNFLPLSSKNIEKFTRTDMGSMYLAMLFAKRIPIKKGMISLNRFLSLPHSLTPHSFHISMQKKQPGSSKTFRGFPSYLFLTTVLHRPQKPETH